ncbi:MAG: hypothetical protein JSR82_17385 [Verrucomicrobia bacterium]|nr:hypothetical protein [Verrucomicrobiota bacterium]
MAPLRLRTALLSALTAPVNSGLWALGLRRPDPWRRTLGLGLRGEGTKFALSAFGVRCEARESDEALARRLAGWLQRTNADGSRYALRHGRWYVERVAVERVPVALLEFESDGALRSLLPLDEVPLVAERIAAVLAAHGRTANLVEAERPSQLAGVLEEAARPWADCVGISFEAPPADRFAPPDFRRRRGLGGAGLDFVLRRAPGAAEFDVWMLLQHTLDDGAPRQELLTRLEREWGTQPSAFPVDPGAVVHRAKPCAVEGERPLHLARDFVDLTPLQRWARDRRSPVAAALLWWLARQPEVEGRRFGVAVDVPPGDGFPRAVDLIGVRPADFRDFADFAAHFTQRAAEARARRGPSWRALRNAAFLPASLAAEWMEAREDLAAETFGTMGVTMLREARVFVAPMADFGWRDGFLALGSTALPTVDGGRVTSVTLKAEGALGCERLAAVRRAVQACGPGPSG